jgi:hypothetical protein
MVGVESRIEQATLAALTYIRIGSPWTNAIIKLWYSYRFQCQFVTNGSATTHRTSYVGVQEEVVCP